MKGKKENRYRSKIQKCPNCGKKSLKGGNIGLESSGPFKFKTGGISLAMTFARACWNCGHITLKVNTEEWKENAYYRIASTLGQYYDGYKKIPKKDFIPLDWLLKETMDDNEFILDIIEGFCAWTTEESENTIWDLPLTLEMTIGERDGKRGFLVSYPDGR
ncbi:MAG: hypothetical protein ACXABL_12550 [Candidatus Thorarchaeota archaeon]|jgi:hypothetical protein